MKVGRQPMSARQPIGCLGVSRGDDGDHILVLVDEALRQPVVIGLIIEPEDPSPLVEKPVEQAYEIGISACLGDGRMEGGIGGDHRQRILRLDRCGEFRLAGADHLEIIRSVVFGRQARRDAIHQHQRVEEGVQVQEIDIRHHRRSVGQRSDQPLSRQPNQRFTDRRARHLEPFGELHLVDRTARRQNQIEDFVPQEVIDHLHAGTALAFGS